MTNVLTTTGHMTNTARSKIYICLKLNELFLTTIPRRPEPLFYYDQTQFFKFISYNFVYRLSVHTLAELKLVKKKAFMAKHLQKQVTTMKQIK